MMEEESKEKPFGHQFKIWLYSLFTFSFSSSSTTTFSSSKLLPIAYGATSFSIAAINNIWVTYNYPFFLSCSVAEGNTFPVIFLLFMAWNGLNDPLFGWMSDVMGTTQGPGRRIPYIRFGGWWLAISFLFSWFPALFGLDQNGSDMMSGFHLSLSLFLYDGALTFIEVRIWQQIILLTI